MFAPPLTNVTLPQFHTIYVYSEAKLWLAYGIAISFAALGVAIGCYAMLSERATYSNNFSTFVRASRHAIISAAIDPVDDDGRDPLPQYLAIAEVSFPRPGTSRELSPAAISNSSFLIQKGSTHARYTALDSEVTTINKLGSSHEE